MLLCGKTGTVFGLGRDCGHTVELSGGMVGRAHRRELPCDAGKVVITKHRSRHSTDSIEHEGPSGSSSRSEMERKERPSDIDRLL